MAPVVDESLDFVLFGVFMLGFTRVRMEKCVDFGRRKCDWYFGGLQLRIFFLIFRSMERSVDVHGALPC